MQQFDINHVVKAIVERCQTEEEVYELLSDLASVNWPDAIAKKRYEDSLGIWQGFIPGAAMFARDALSVQKTLAEVKNVGS